jgi:DNA-binding transcriptional ArsR family regulator
MDFAKAIKEEKTRIEKRVAELNQQKADIDTEIKKVLLELDAVNAYEHAKQGKPSRSKRGSSIRAQVLSLIKAKPCTRAEIIQALGLQNDKGKQQTVSNSLSTLKKQGKVSLKDGVYSPH